MKEGKKAENMALHCEHHQDRAKWMPLRFCTVLHSELRSAVFMGSVLLGELCATLWEEEWNAGPGYSSISSM
jgi:hypothetical protein